MDVKKTFVNQVAGIATAAMKPTTPRAMNAATRLLLIRLTYKVTGDHGPGEAPPMGVRVDRPVRHHV